MNTGVLIGLAFCILVLVGIFAVSPLHKAKIAKAARGRGWDTQSVDWWVPRRAQPFNPLYNIRSRRCYRVRYVDADGRSATICCWSSLVTGLEWFVDE